MQGGGQTGGFFQENDQNWVHQEDLVTCSVVDRSTRFGATLLDVNNQSTQPCKKDTGAQKQCLQNSPSLAPYQLRAKGKCLEIK